MSVYAYQVKDVNQKEVSLKDYEGKVLLIINSATKCGLTPQYEGLEKLYKTYKDKGFEILDFPCNQFMNQAPGTDQELKSFCELTYGTTFKTFAKIEVNGKNTHPLYKFLRNEKKKDLGENGKTGLLSRLMPNTSIKWNFTKFLIDRNGQVIHRFGPGFTPDKIGTYIEEVL
ncbi:MAG: glutathione peroxidase [Tenericutes bacterium GWC2_34_14]|nr:MAG: glutathione peroxidase [Tenericutes bacterium GWA2_35_7]OHE28254.1 MAG: glutathione peroxidase [Tenericutes bacterium GWC2_34_14]OHE33120.1 MAG: glutathione peroxidase [Tenericutes bacterium GWE2_34_108]OHE36240.1 MAG: glutathione peroxidase [Tenericutes bacterium GWF1_35_14]OHE38718.1 MAG: glutathione peroxidase [Tenericutes bacterium GWF2_35_184]OHE43038.1 MAG: glutathione peroxidase [Tenericutes bacterium RIFOXYA12_FULL_35_10]OHE44782.1 MAG: glutathione peroxidase [Tenericutes bact